jgi:hypothetical protein
MVPDLSLETRNAWLVFAGTTVVVLGVLWYIWDGTDPLSDQVAHAQSERDKLAGASKQDMHQRVEQQAQANRELERTIEKLKGESGFEVSKRFTIPATENQPGYLFKRRFVEVRQELREKAAPRSIRYDENIGFGTDEKVPDDSQAPYLMAMLQLTAKAITIAIGTPEPLESMSITHGPAIDTGPENRPTLLREYPLELKVHGNLRDILWILHSISQVDTRTSSGDQNHDYPLILRGLVIQSENAKQKDDINEIDATFRIAGMQFLSMQEREHLPGMPGRPSITHATGGSHFQSHP